ncbi:MAG: XRE family transcriptional regulator [Fimbriimonadaceae bacterium]
MKFGELLVQESAVRSVLDSVPADVLAARIRRERLAQGISIRELATMSNIGKSSIVRLEAGKGSRPMTLLKICAALNLHPDRLTKGSHSSSVAIHRHSDDRWYELENVGAGKLGGLDRPLPAAVRKELAQQGHCNPILLLQSRLPEGKLLPTLIEIYEPSKVRSHPGEEFVFVLKGRALIQIDGVPYELDEGESLHFWGTEPHSYASMGAGPALILSARISP